MVGFKSVNKQVVVSDKDIILNVELIENVIQLNEVVVKPDLNRENNLKTFTDFFIFNFIIGKKSKKNFFFSN